MRQSGENTHETSASKAAGEATPVSHVTILAVALSDLVWTLPFKAEEVGALRQQSLYRGNPGVAVPGWRANRDEPPVSGDGR
jgi:hypothetical protein